MPLEQLSAGHTEIVAGKIYEGKVTGITSFGAFVEIAPGKTGLVHISEVSNVYVRDIKEHLKIDEKVKVKVLNVGGGKIALSVRQAMPPAETPAPAPRFRSAPDRQAPPPAAAGAGESFSSRRKDPGSFEDKLARFMKDSDERQTALRRSMDAKRGGRGTRRSE